MRRDDQENWEAEHNGRNQDYSEDCEPNQSCYGDWEAGQDEQRFEDWEENQDYDEGAIEHDPHYYEGAVDQSNPCQSHYSDDWEAGPGGQEECYDNWDSNDQYYEDDYE
ncbi:hypothetical protein BO78DRAFT_416593 [Aspergillus sclerotiicarbonarius CBS 121057]|uniref:Uncharacterized protein n=1 Tax=Aspergillus sclerotiicarbonarius (strain CBS 121057 / IBT 28362) TaxID=1448318 RepID=A0A319EEP4_ASPSB|nr:hypothetical protein BO78DRAFT_416593 [Aspergillus sclerotiicarbonarius CBS 121057]